MPLQRTPRAMTDRMTCDDGSTHAVRIPLPRASGASIKVAAHMLPQALASGSTDFADFA